jgi:outer membrane protein, heavy metal efflux system
MRVCLCLIVLLAPAALQAQPRARIALAEVVAEALAKSPEIAAAERRLDAARQRPAQERSLPDPVLSAGYDAAGRPWPGAGLGSEPTANIGFMVSQELPYPGKRDLRGAIASREADAEGQQVEAVRLSVTARVKQAYYRLAYTYAAADALARNRALLETLVKVSETRYGVGQAAQQDVIKAQTQLTILQLQLERLGRERLVREAELNALLARRPATPVGQPDDLQLTDFEPSIDDLVAAAGTHAPLLRRDAVLIDRAQLGLDAARQDYKPDFAVSGGYYYMGEMPPMYAFRFDVRIPLQRSRRNAAVAEQVNTVEAAKRSLESARLDIQARLQEDLAIASASARLARLYRESVLPQARLALESSMASYQTGRVDFLSVLTSFGTVLEYEISYYDELASFHAAVSRLEELTGAPLVH